MEGKTSRSGSKTNLNESNLPLLEEKGVAIELKGKGDEATVETVTADNGAAPKAKKSFKNVVPRIQSPGAVAANFTVGLNIHDRDEHKINDQVNIIFEDVIAEPDPTQNFEFIWRLSYLFFNGIRFWLYRLIAAVLALPFAVLWAVLFAVLNVFVIWVATPSFKVLDIILWHVQKLWTGLVRTILDPLFVSIGLAFGRNQQGGLVGLGLGRPTHVVANHVQVA